MSEHEIDPAEMVRRLMADIDADIVELEIKGTDYEARIGALMAGASVKEVAMDEAVKIEDAVYLPELGGVWTENSVFSKPSGTHAVKTLRSAITTGALGVERPNTKNQFLTRQLLKEWRAACQDSTKGHTSSPEKPVATSKAVSRTKPPGSSKTETRSVAQDAVSMIVKGLK